MSIVALRAELAKPAYAAALAADPIDVDAVLALLNANTQIGPVPVAEARDLMMALGALPVIQLVAMGAYPPAFDTLTAEQKFAARAIAQAISASLIVDDQRPFRMDDANARGLITSMMDQAILANLMTSAQKAAVLALGDNRKSLASKLIGRVATAADVVGAVFSDDGTRAI